MVAALAPDVLVRQVESLAADLRALTGPTSRRIHALLSSPEWAAAGHICLTGAGDSYYASRAAQLAFETISGIACEPISAQYFADYAASSLRLRPARPVVIAASASGRTPAAIAALASAREHGVTTVAVTGDPDSPVARAAGQSIAVELSNPERSPGVRTYQATLLALLMIAIELGARRETSQGARPRALREELGELADHVEATAGTVKERCRKLATVIAAEPVMTFLGSGPSLGTALFGAAKLTETVGTAAIGQDLDEWWHVERRAMPADMPVFVIAPPGRSHPRAALAAAAARRLGRRVIAVVDSRDGRIAQHAQVVLPVQAAVREEFSPLLYHVFAGYTAAFVAQQLGRSIFPADPPDLPRTLDGFAAPAGPGGHEA